MPFTCHALNKQTKVRSKVFVGNYASPKVDLAGHELTCHVCGAPVYIRHTMMVDAHFAHFPDLDRVCALEGLGESPDHRWAKGELLKKLKAHPAYRKADIDLEVPVLDGKRIADIMVVYPDGQKECHEIQLSPITTEILMERTNDYRKDGCEVIWWLGPKAREGGTEQHCIDVFGFVGRIDIQKTTESREI